MDNREYYDRISENYAHREILGYHRFLNEMTEKILKATLPKGNVLDAGCGSGHLARRLSDSSGKRSVTGVDISLSMLKQFHSMSSLSAVQGALERLPFASNTFDAAFSMRVFPHLRNPEAALAELSRVVRPGGAVLVEIYNPISLRAGIKALSNLFKQTQPITQIHETMHKQDFDGDTLKISSKDSDSKMRNTLFTRYDTIRSFRSIIAPGLEYQTYYGLRIMTPAGKMMDIPGIGSVLTNLERFASRSGLKIFAGFLILVLRKVD